MVEVWSIVVNIGILGVSRLVVFFLKGFFLLKSV